MALRRSQNKVIAGVCAGLAEAWDLEPTLVRVVYGVGTLFSIGLGLVLYLILYLVMDDPA